MSRPSTSCLLAVTKTWMPGTRPGMTSGWSLRHAQFVAADHHPVHFIRTVGEAEMTNVLVHLAERAPLRDAGGAVHLDRLVDDLAGALRHHGFHHADPDPRFLVAEHVHGFRSLEHHQPHRLDLAAGLRNDLHIAAEMGDLLAEGFAGEAALYHQVKRLFGFADRAHAVMDAARSEPDLRDFKTAAFAEQHVFLRHPAIVEAQMHVAARRVVVAEHVHRAQNLDAGGVDRHQDLRLLLARRRIRIGLHHHDHDLAARIA